MEIDEAWDGHGIGWAWYGIESLTYTTYLAIYYKLNLA